MENRAHAFAAGLFVILLSAALAMAVKWFSSESITYDHYFVISEGGSVSGLNPEASVRYRGVNVGKVEDIYFDVKNMRNIIVRIAVSNQVTLPQNVYAQLASQGITGLAYIELNDDILEIGVGDLEPGMHIPLRLSLIKTLSDSLEEVLRNSNEAIKRMNSLLNEQNQAHIGDILGNLARTIQHYDDFVLQFQTDIQALPQLTNESLTTLKHTQKILGDVGQALQKINQQGGIADRITHGSLEMAETLTSLRETSSAITQSTQTLNQLLHSLENQPQSLIFGKPPAQPGPGEAGFLPPQSN
ncbi:MlaD family protein [Nitrosomonas halophila]|uniref:Phospholipid/cholesterol/gamma-HCH transport system substrate-binding protein n=1 Tax=Nitrosomonas halophila TaxID=44576 RepID=A0A1H3HEF4_9PROT|nr:MlaD family protein [Nitrosomonas halophila]SDY13710.1 phospholipid/cholesterol/gamma-HCH transport system substrate-binding protein [Nitrosomonas halophila]